MYDTRDGRLVGPLLTGGVRVWPRGANASYRTTKHFHITADGRKLVWRLRNGDKELATVWDLESRELLARVERKGPGAAIAVSPTGSFLAVPVEDGAFLSDGSPDGAKGRMLSGLLGVFSPDGRYLATRDGKQVRLWEVDVPDSPAVFLDHVDPVCETSFSPDGRVLATMTCSGIGLFGRGGIGATRNCWILWDVGERARLPSPPCTVGRWPMATFSPDSRLLAYTDSYTPVGVWDVRSGTAAAELKDEGPLSALEFSPDGRTLVVSHSAILFRGATSHLWDLSDQPPTLVHAFDSPRLHFSPDSRAVAHLVKGGFGFWNVLDRQPLGTIVPAKLEKPPWSLGGDPLWFLLSPDGRLLATRNAGEILLWDVPRIQLSD